jgi:hypothetical protein
MFANSEEGTQMTKKQKQSKKAAKNSKRTKVAPKPEDETDTATQSAVAEAPQVAPSTQEAEIAVESQQPVAASAPATPVTPSNPGTRSDAAKANIKEGLRLHQIAGRPTKQQLILVFGKAGYLLTWPKRTEKFGITPETFQAALAKGVPAVPLTPVAKPNVEKTKETA